MNTCTHKIVISIRHIIIVIIIKSQIKVYIIHPRIDK